MSAQTPKKPPSITDSDYKQASDVLDFISNPIAENRGDINKIKSILNNKELSALIEWTVGAPDEFPDLAQRGKNLREVIERFKKTPPSATEDQLNEGIKALRNSLGTSWNEKYFIETEATKFNKAFDEMITTEEINKNNYKDLFDRVANIFDPSKNKDAAKHKETFEKIYGANFLMQLKKNVNDIIEVSDIIIKNLKEAKDKADKKFPDPISPLEKQKFLLSSTSNIFKQHLEKIKDNFLIAALLKDNFATITTNLSKKERDTLDVMKDNLSILVLLDDCLMRPVQRTLKYELLFRELGESKAGAGLSAQEQTQFKDFREQSLKSTLDSINEEKRKNEQILNTKGNEKEITKTIGNNFSVQLLSYCIKNPATLNDTGINKIQAELLSKYLKIILIQSQLVNYHSLMMDRDAKNQKKHEAGFIAARQKLSQALKEANEKNVLSISKALFEEKTFKKILANDEAVVGRIEIEVNFDKNTKMADEANFVNKVFEEASLLASRSTPAEEAAKKEVAEKALQAAGAAKLESAFRAGELKPSVEHGSASLASPRPKAALDIPPTPSPRSQSVITPRTAAPRGGQKIPGLDQKGINEFKQAFEARDARLQRLQAESKGVSDMPQGGQPKEFRGRMRSDALSSTPSKQQQTFQLDAISQSTARAIGVNQRITPAVIQHVQNHIIKSQDKKLYARFIVSPPSISHGPQRPVDVIEADPDKVIKDLVSTTKVMRDKILEETRQQKSSGLEPKDEPHFTITGYPPHIALKILQEMEKPENGMKAQFSKAVEESIKNDSTVSKEYEAYLKSKEKAGVAPPKPKT